jgi:hypothetical protein
VLVRNDRRHPVISCDRDHQRVARPASGGTPYGTVTRPLGSLLSITLIGAGSGRCRDAPDANTAGGTALEIWSCERWHRATLAMTLIFETVQRKET